MKTIVSDPPASIRDPASIRTTRFTDEHVFKTPRFLVLYLLLQSEIPGRPTSLAVYSPLDLPPASSRDPACIRGNTVVKNAHSSTNRLLGATN